MKSIFFTLLLTVIFLISCDKKDADHNSFPLIGKIQNEAVDNYVNLLIKGNYNEPQLPDFTYEDIPALLQYGNDTTFITNFPHNGISSLWLPECRLGIYVLWTIESIRAVAINSKYLILNFPSQNPALALRGHPELTLVWNLNSQMVAAKAYYDWWTNNDNKTFDEIKNIDPLGNTEYFWH